MFLGAALLAGCQQKAAEAEPKTMTEDQKSVYAYGAAIGQQLNDQLKQLRLTPEELDAFRSGFSDTLGGKESAVDIGQYENKFKALADARIAAGLADLKQQGADFVANAAKEPGAVTTASGLVYRTVSAGQGASPKVSDTVRVHYHGTLIDGTVFDSSVDRGQPAEFALNRVIKCWTEGVQLMKVGEKAKFVCPPNIAYGDRGAGGTIPPGSTLIFDVELLEIKAN
jgi:FKBP-type peptidyl-prolyl cis-trans isomerase